MKRLPLLISIISLIFLPLATVQADSFTGFTMDFVDIGNASNAADDTTYGAVDYSYQMGTHEVSGAMIDAYNTNSGGSAITRCENPSRRGELERGSAFCKLAEYQHRECRGV